MKNEDNMKQNTNHSNGDGKRPNWPLSVARYVEQNARWPQEGQHILAHHDPQSVIVYQAYRPSIGRHAIDHGRFGGPDFSFNRMSWIKPNFLWMMYRCGWGTKPGQDIVLALRLHRAFFNDVLRRAVPSSYAASSCKTPEEWAAAVSESDVRLQWDPDHAPSGAKVARRALQLGLRGSALKQFASDALIEVIDMTHFVAAQRPFARDDSAELVTPVEEVYPHDALPNESQ